MKPSKFGYSLSALIDGEMVEKLEADREETLKWCLSKLKNPKRSVCKPEPWIEATQDKYQVKFSWNAETKPPIVDTEGTVLEDPNIPLYNGSSVKLAFFQKPYILKDGETYGTSLKLLGVQVIELKGGAGIDKGDLSAEDVAELFGTSKGFKQSEPSVTPAPEPVVEDDFDF